MTLNLISRIYKEPRGLGGRFNSAYLRGRIPAILPVGVISHRKKLRICSAKWLQYMCCLLVEVEIREFCEFVFVDDTPNKFPCQHKSNTVLTFYCNCVIGTPLIWPKQHNWLRRPGGLWEAPNLISLQTSNCKSNKYTTSKYLA